MKQKKKPVDPTIKATYWVSLRLPVTIKENRSKLNSLPDENNALAESILAFSKKKIIRGLKEVVLKEKWI